jgi:hypothetical protein
VNLSSFGRRWITLADVATAGAALRSYFDTIYTGAGTAYTPGGTDVVVADGGTGVSSLTAYALLAGGTTSTNPVQSLAGLGTAGDLLTSNGAGALPAFQTPAAINYGTGNAALAAGGVGTYAMLVFTGNTTARSAGFTVAGSSLSFTNGLGTTGLGTASGTWRLMGAIPVAGGNVGNTSVWLRIS